MSVFDYVRRPGPPKTMPDASSTYFIRWKVRWRLFIAGESFMTSFLEQGSLETKSDFLMCWSTTKWKSSVDHEWVSVSFLHLPPLDCFYYLISLWAVAWPGWTQDALREADTFGKDLHQQPRHDRHKSSRTDDILGDTNVSKYHEALISCF